MLIVLKLLGSIALLIFGMKVMSEALQKMAGPQLRHLLGSMTKNRFSGVATGALVTVAVQSSAATTVMTVSFVNAALLTLSQAISVIMGANIGTTLSAWIMSAGFSFNITNVVWPAFVVGIILIQLGKHRYIGDFLFGLSFLLFALGMLKATGVEMDLASKPAVVDFFASFQTNYGTILLFLLIGTILTAMVQSSAALMAITMVLCATGAITIYQGIALVMGENIGTTVTANLAAMSANTQARRTAMAHLLFNVFGVIWVLIFFFPFVRMVCSIVGMDPTAAEQSPTQLSFALATFHTCFNVINTAVLIWFIPQIEKLVCLIIKPKKSDEEDEFRLQYIRSGIMKTPELSVFQAQKEIAVFGEKMQRMFGLVKELYVTADEKAFDALFERIKKGEEMSDQIIRSFLMEEVSRLFLIILMILKNSLMRTRIRISASTAIRMLRTGCAMTQEKTPLWGTVTAAVSSSVLICLHSALCIPALFCLLCRLFLFLQDCACAAAAVRLRSRRCLLRRVKEP